MGQVGDPPVERPSAGVRPCTPSTVSASVCRPRCWKPIRRRAGPTTSSFWGDFAECAGAAVGARTSGQFSPPPDECALDRFGAKHLPGGICRGFHSASDLGGEARALPVQLHRFDRRRSCAVFLCAAGA